MKTRRHHNNKGYRQIKRGKTFDQVRAMARRLGVPFGSCALREIYLNLSPAARMKAEIEQQAERAMRTARREIGNEPAVKRGRS